MILTKKDAENHIDEYIDCKKRMFGNYPMEIIRLDNGEVGLKDAVGVCTRIEDTGFNARHYDYMLKITSGGAEDGTAD